jgi:hypothetical protein
MQMPNANTHSLDINTQPVDSPQRTARHICEFPSIGVTQRVEVGRIESLHGIIVHILVLARAAQGVYQVRRAPLPRHPQHLLEYHHAHLGRKRTQAPVPERSRRSWEGKLG